MRPRRSHSCDARLTHGSGRPAVVGERWGAEMAQVGHTLKVRDAQPHRCCATEYGFQPRADLEPAGA